MGGIIKWTCEGCETRHYNFAKCKSCERSFCRDKCIRKITEQSEDTRATSKVYRCNNKKECKKRAEKRCPNCLRRPKGRFYPCIECKHEVCKKCVKQTGWWALFGGTRDRKCKDKNKCLKFRPWLDRLGGDGLEIRYEDNLFGGINHQKVTQMPSSQESDDFFDLSL